MTTKTCSTCKHSTPWKRGFARCALLKPWEYLAARCACVFKPSRWEAA